MPLFNNYSNYPNYQNYNPNYQQQMPQNQMPQQPVQPNMSQNNGIIWVQGEAGAKSYLVAPNSTVQLWDSESQVIYLKSADSTGMPSIKILDYTIRNGENPSHISFNTDFATKEDIRHLEEQIEELKGKLKPATTSRKTLRREVEENEQ